MGLGQCPRGSQRAQSVLKRCLIGNRLHYSLQLRHIHGTRANLRNPAAGFLLPEGRARLQPVHQIVRCFERRAAMAAGGQHEHDGRAHLKPAVAVNDDGAQQRPAPARAVQQCLNTVGRMNLDASRRAELESGCALTGRVEPVYNETYQAPTYYYGGGYIRPYPPRPVPPTPPPKSGKPVDLYKVPSAPRR